MAHSTKPLAGIDWNEVRLIALQIGVREAARQFHINEETVKARSKREGWLRKPEAIQHKVDAINAKRRIDRGMHPTAPKAIDILSEYGRKTKFSLAKAASKAAACLEKKTGRELLNEGQTACHWTKVAATVHGFGGDGAVSLRLELIARGHGSAAESGPAIDGEVTVERLTEDSDDL